MELKEIVSYLPYQLKVYSKSLNKSFTIVPAQPRNLETERTASEFLKYSRELKPMLRPLSSLTEEECNTLRTLLLPAGKAYKSHFVSVLKRLDLPLEYIINKTPFVLIQKLYEWHFDIHSLIDKDEAIDISCL